MVQFRRSYSTTNDFELVSNFHIAFPNFKMIQSSEKILLLVNYNTAVGSWYRELRHQESVKISMPQSFIKAGFTTEMWENLKLSRDRLVSANISYTQDCTRLSEKFRLDFKKLADSRSLVLKDMPIPVKIACLSVNHLPEEDHIILVMIDDIKIRSEKAKELVRNFQELLIKEFIDTGKISKDLF